jgi:hypothetical protein
MYPIMRANAMPDYQVVLPQALLDGARNYQPDADAPPVPVSELIRTARAQLEEVDPRVTWRFQHLQLVGVNRPEPGTDWFTRSGESDSA